MADSDADDCAAIAVRLSLPLLPIRPILPLPPPSSASFLAVPLAFLRSHLAAKNPAAAAAAEQTPIGMAAALLAVSIAALNLSAPLPSCLRRGRRRHGRLLRSGSGGDSPRDSAIIFGDFGLKRLNKLEDEDDEPTHVCHRASIARPTTVATAGAEADVDWAQEVSRLAEEVAALREENRRLKSAAIEGHHRSDAEDATVTEAGTEVDDEDIVDEEDEEENARLKAENAELLAELQRAQIALGNSIDPVLEKDALTAELCEANEKLLQELEELRNSHNTHVEELIYLKWLNACLRHKLQEHRPNDRCAAADASAARSLSMNTLSYRSQEIARQLVLRYSSDGGASEFDLIHSAVRNATASKQPPVAAETEEPAGSRGVLPRKLKNKLLSGLKKLKPKKKDEQVILQAKISPSEFHTTIAADDYSIQWAMDLDASVNPSSSASTPPSTVDSTATYSRPTEQCSSTKSLQASISDALDGKVARTNSDDSVLGARRVMPYRSFLLGGASTGRVAAAAAGTEL